MKLGIIVRCASISVVTLIAHTFVTDCIPLSSYAFASNQPMIHSLISRSVLSSTDSTYIDLQSPHRKETPSEAFTSIAVVCESLGIDEFDTYGDFTLDKEKSAIRKFEHEVACALGKEDAVFMPSGVMAQNIALMIHSKHGVIPDVSQTSTQKSTRFLCHHTSHLLLHEKEAFRELLGLEAIIISTKDRCAENGINVPPMMFADVEKALFLEGKQHKKNVSSSDPSVFALIIELPHRELGGKITPWEDIERMQNLCQFHGIKFHCDGARIFEACAGYGLTLPEIASPFDSVYISSYKGLGAISGALLLGTAPFCQEARTWLRRFGGNLKTLMPYAASSWLGFRKQLGPNGDTGSFAAKKEKLQRVVKALVKDKLVRKYVCFDPEIPETNMVHGYLRVPIALCEQALDSVEKKTGIKVLGRILPLDITYGSIEEFGCRFEWVMGDTNSGIDDDTFLHGWKTFASSLEEIGKQSD